MTDLTVLKNALGALENVLKHRPVNELLVWGIYDSINGLRDLITRMEASEYKPQYKYDSNIGERGGVIWKNAADAPKIAPAMQPTPRGIEPTEAMCKAARGFIMGLDMNCRKWGVMHTHLDAGGFPTLPYITEKAANDPKGHITKWDVADCIWQLMSEAALTASAKPNGE